MACDEVLDPRVKRTRGVLRTALMGLLGEKSFEDVSVADVTERAGVNRATFYDHYMDKYGLLEDVIGEDFRGMLGKRMEGTGGTCEEGIKQLILGVCDFLTDLGSRCQKHRKVFGPLVEAKVKGMVRGFLLEKLRGNNPGAPGADLELKATMASWGIYGAASEWACNPGQNSDKEGFAERVRPLIMATLQIG
ncbi:hypothetical protein BH09VER1_BH09VER1_28230 [soil metagenome]